MPTPKGTYFTSAAELIRLCPLLKVFVQFYNFITNRAEERNNGLRDTSESTCSVATRCDRTEHPVGIIGCFNCKENFCFVLGSSPEVVINESRPAESNLEYVIDARRDLNVTQNYIVTQDHLNCERRNFDEQCSTNCIFWFDAEDINVSSQDQQNSLYFVGFELNNAFLKEFVKRTEVLQTVPAL
uniref:Uncharacterized protein n=1 Tax=Glossina pallidipes TaxID=7398 RepID=A0A1A9ZWE5_GLOPL